MRARFRFASCALAVPLLVGLLSAPASADDQGPIARLKHGALTPALQEIAKTPTAPALTGQPGTPLETASGRVLVEMRATDITPELLVAVRAAGGRTVFVDRDMNTITIAVLPTDVTALAALGPQVISIREILTPMTNAACPTGDFVSEGVAQLKVDLARSTLATDGSGVTIGVISDSYDSLGSAESDVSNGELPGATNPCGNTTPIGNLLEGPFGGMDEGRAMAQIVHDVAPGVRILFASAFFGDAAFAQSIRDLAAAGADIIVDDVSYLLEPMFQDGVIARAVRDVTADGVVYFSSAANSNVTISGNRVASYEAPSFRPTACPTIIDTQYAGATVDCHDFDPGVLEDSGYDLTFSSLLRYTLGWSEPVNGVTTDLDFCVVDKAGTTVIYCASSVNPTTGLPAEYVASGESGDVALVVVRVNSTGTPRLKFISHRSDLTAVEYATGSGGDIVGPTIFGHNASIPGVTVAAVPYDDSSALENFSSFGPAVYCWEPVNGPTPSGPLNPCQSATVDIAATDGGINSFFPPGDGPPFRFYGTSAAAPHAAAVAALMLQGQQCLSPDQTKAALAASGRDVGTAPVDGAGAGLIDAVAAVTAGDCETPSVNAAVSAGWFRNGPVSATATAKDNRVVTELVCSGVNAGAATGLDTTSASVNWSVVGEGHYTVDCSATDLNGNVGRSRVDFGIDTTPPVVTCRPSKIPLRSSGRVNANVTDALSGPITTSVSNTVSGRKTGRFTTEVTGADVAGNTTTVGCSYTVAVMPQLRGPAKVTSGGKKTYRLSGLPSKARVKWTVKLKGTKVQSGSSKANKAGLSTCTVRFAKKGKYVVVVRASGATVKKTVKAR